MEVQNPNPTDSFFTAIHKEVYDTIQDALQRTDKFLAETYVGTTVPSVYTSKLKELKASMEPFVRTAQRDNKLYLQKESKALDDALNIEFSKSQELKDVLDILKTHTENETGLQVATARVTEINQVFATAAAARGKEGAPAKPPKNAASLEEERTALQAQIEARGGLFHKIKETVLQAKERLQAFITKLKETGFIEKAAKVWANIKDAVELVQKIINEGRELATDLGVVKVDTTVEVDKTASENLKD